ncbi:MAG: tetratricopeptide repeat protein [Acidobacteria bacterium]|nr:tetratricopeptide repeat protein [Acidobacteriota bacterium]
MIFRTTKDRRGVRLAIILAVTVAVAVEGLDAGGWALWRDLMVTARERPAEGCRVLLSTALLAGPPAAEWARTITAGPLMRKAGQCGLEAVARAAWALRRWTPVDPAGWTLGARAELAAGRLDKGMGLLRAALQRNPTSPYLHRLMALLDMNLGDYDGALQSLADAEGLAPGYRIPPVEVLPGDDEWIAIEGLRRRAALYPRHRQDALLALASKLWSLGRRDEAREVLAPLRDRPVVLMTRARWALEDGDPRMAVRLMRPVAERSAYPRRIRSRAYSLLARALEAEGESERAMKTARKAVMLDPNSPEPYLALSRLARRRGDTEAALQYIRSAWGVAPSDVRVLLEVASTAEAAGAYSDARLALERAEKLAPDRVDVGVRLAGYLLRRGEYMNAALVLSRQLDRHPMEPRLIALAARLQGKTSRRR